MMLKPRGFKYRSGQYIFLQCPSISPFEWSVFQTLNLFKREKKKYNNNNNITLKINLLRHPFSITSAPGDEYLSVHIRTVGDWTRELKRVFTEHVNSKPVLARAKLGHLVKMERKRYHLPS